MVGGAVVDQVGGLLVVGGAVVDQVGGLLVVGGAVVDQVSGTTGGGRGCSEPGRRGCWWWEGL